MCGVAGAPDRECGQIIHAFVVTEKSPDRPEPTEQELRESVGKKLSSFKVPDRWIFLESLPLNANGKIARRALERTGAWIFQVIRDHAGRTITVYLSRFVRVPFSMVIMLLAKGISSEASCVT
ncbi:MAG: hypothetical protein AB2L14_14630 [Candidatus Xenobiia bacterium LiM19]